MTSASLAGDQGSIWTGNLSLPLTHVAADGRITSFPKIAGTICLRLDRDGTIWSAGGGDACSGILQASAFSPMHYPEDEVGPVISLAVDRNNELWINTATGGTYHLTQGNWNRQERSAGQKAGHSGSDGRRRRGKRLVWLLQLPGQVGWQQLPEILLSQRCTRRLGNYHVGARVTTSGSVDRAGSNCLPRAISTLCVGKTRICPAESPAWWKQRPATFG